MTIVQSRSRIKLSYFIISVVIISLAICYIIRAVYATNLFKPDGYCGDILKHMIRIKSTNQANANTVVEFLFDLLLTKFILKRCILRKSSKKYARYLTEPTDQRNTNFICEICNCTFLHKSYIVEHMKIVHSENSISKQTDGKYAFRCLICKKTFAHKKSLRNHTNQMHNDDQKYFTCNCCNKKFLSEKKYLLHMNGKFCTKKIQCSICARTFKSFYDLEKHFNRCGKEHRL